MGGNFFDESSLLGIPIVAIEPDVGSLVEIGSIEGCFHGDFVHAESGTGESCPNYGDAVKLGHALDPTTLPYPPWKQGKIMSNFSWIKFILSFRA